MNCTKHSCGCTDKNGHRKKLYLDKWLAEEQVQFAKEDRQVNLKIYKCPQTGRGYHLTSNLW